MIRRLALALFLALSPVAAFANPNAAPLVAWWNSVKSWNGATKSDEIKGGVHAVNTSSLRFRPLTNGATPTQLLTRRVGFVVSGNGTITLRNAGGKAVKTFEIRGMEGRQNVQWNYLQHQAGTMILEVKGDVHLRVNKIDPFCSIVKRGISDISPDNRAAANAPAKADRKNGKAKDRREQKRDRHEAKRGRK